MKLRYLTVLGMVIVLTAAFSATVLDLYRASVVDTYAGHVVFVPLFAAVMLWADRVALRNAVAPGDYRGLVVMAAALGLLALGRWHGSLVLQSLALAAAVAGACLVAGGRRLVTRAAFPIAFLALMAPPPRAVIEVITLHLQNFAAGFAVAVLRLIDVPVFRAGVMLELPNARLEVAEICNGLRFLLALVVMTSAFAQITQPSAVHKLILVAAAVPIAVFANATRVAIIALGAHWFGAEMATGPVHHAIGKAVWVLTLAPLALLTWWLPRWQIGAGYRRRTVPREEAA